MVYRRALRHPGLDAVHAVVDELAKTERWREPPPGAWLPEADAAAFGIAVTSAQ